LASYKFDMYKAKDKQLATLNLISEKESSDWNRGQMLGYAQNLARNLKDMVNLSLIISLQIY
jgi:leucyl aminopeptidase